MSREFAVRREVELPADREAVFAAITTGTAGWMFPIGEIEPRVGGAAPFGGKVTAWNPPEHTAIRTDGPDGWFNALDYVLEATAGNTTVLRYVHSGIFTDDWDNQFDGVGQHTDFYLHTLSEYLQHFAGKPTTYIDLQAPESSKNPTAFDSIRAALGFSAATTALPSVGNQVAINIDGIGTINGVVDYSAQNFLGVRTDDALYCYFGRNAFGATVGMSVHHFGSEFNEVQLTKGWQSWLDGLYS